MTDSSNFGCAVRSDGSLKDASEISWHYDVDDDLPIAPVGSTSSTPISPPNIHPFFTSHPAPAKMVAGSRRSACTVTAAYATITSRLGVVVTRLSSAAFWLGMGE
jgi:hypothetical protein